MVFKDFLLFTKFDYDLELDIETGFESLFAFLWSIEDILFLNSSGTLLPPPESEIEFLVP